MPACSSGFDVHLKLDAATIYLFEIQSIQYAQRLVANRLSPSLRDRVLDRLGLTAPPPLDLAGLRLLYARWSATVPFDNVRKVIALRAAKSGPLPGLDAEDFLETWLSDGVGGTCWTGANALWALLDAVGFDARRVAGSMGDRGVVTHGTVKVAIDGVDWLVDSSMQTFAPVEVGPRVTMNVDPVVTVEVEPVADGHLVWFDAPPGTHAMPCRLLVDPASPTFYEERYEASRTASPFNQRVYARRHAPGRALVLVGPARITRTASGQESRQLTRDDVLACLRDEIGISGRVIDEWVACGGLEASFEPYAGPVLQPPTNVPPSKRVAIQ